MTPDRSALGTGAARPILAYLLVVVGGVWALYVLDEVQRGGAILGAPIAAASAMISAGVAAPVSLAFLLIPAMVLTIELIRRFEARSRATRAVIGAAAWAGWGLVVATTLVVASRVVVVPEVLVGDLLVFGASGAVFSWIAFDGHDRRAGTALTLLALGVAVLVVLGSLWMAGRWGGTA